MQPFNLRKIRSFFLIGVIAIIAVVLLVFSYETFTFGQNTPGEISRIYFADNISTAHRTLINRFNSAHTGKIEVIPVDLPFTKFSTNERKVLLARSLRSKNRRIDVFAVDLVWVPRFARWAEPLDLAFQPSERKALLDVAMESCYHDGKLVSVPLYIDISMMYYRKDILDQFPDAAALEAQLQSSITWESLIDLKRRAPNSDMPIYMFPALNFEGLICSFVELMASQNVPLFTADSIYLDTPAARRSLQLLVDLVNRYHLTPAVVSDFDEVNSYAFGLNNDALMMRGWPGLYQQRHIGVTDPAVFDQLRLAPLPHFRGEQPVSVFGGWNLMVSQYSQHKPAAITFIKFLLRPDNQRLLFEIGGYIPISRKVYEDTSFVGQYPELQFYSRLLEQGVHRPYLVDYTRYSDILSYYLYMAIKNEIDVGSALQKAHKEILSRNLTIR